MPFFHLKKDVEFLVAFTIRMAEEKIDSIQIENMKLSKEISSFHGFMMFFKLEAKIVVCQI